jgi:hypothetical protein
MTEYDNIVVAAQEHAAKHGFVCILLRTEKWQMLYRQSLAFMPSINHISAVYVTGIAVRKVSSSVIQMGLKL